MANTITSPNMNLPIPVVGVDPGPDWALNVDSCLGFIDQHDHSTGSGVAVTPAGLNINSALPFGGNPATGVSYVQFSPIGSLAVLDAIYMVGVDFFLNDGSGNHIRLTQSGSVAGSSGTITGLPSGTASASFSAGVFTFQAATATPANLDGGSIVLRNNVANSKGLTLSPPNAMGADISITLPNIPVSASFLSMDNTGTITAPTLNSTLSVAGGIASVATGGITPTQMQAMTPSAVATLGNFAQSTSSGAFSNNNNTLNTVVSVTITTSGRPVFLSLIADGTANGNVFYAGAGTAICAFVRGASVVGQYQIPSGSNLFLPSSSYSMFDFQAAGTYTYNFQVASGSGSPVQVNNTQLVAYEI